ncbi:hypothetical protein NLU13_8803 [Sarocladium strictum]|uniref:Zn(2)-C6 fungal-type domain-containing protein n=1 Tax=Sarocladium strictum TaxID=5046 RepID=A0AA39GB49_SARSR|nr:hypothetical protein NLU13_8803 [Sarocladium strictum]
MPLPNQTLACTACVKAKRKCSRQSPACLRCHSRGLDCEYPKPKQTSWVLLPETPPDDTQEEARSSPGSDPHSSVSSVDEADAHAQLSSWFTSTNTWFAVRSQQLEVGAVVSLDIGNYVKRIRGWLGRWVTTGSNPFIHSQIYRRSFPRSVQDALSLSCCMNETPQNEPLVMQLVEERSQALLQEHGVDVDGRPLRSARSGSDHELGLIEHIARVHALLIYQFIGLFGESSHRRHLAQRRIGLMLSWARQMVSAAARIVPLGSKDLLASTNGQGPDEEDLIRILWHSWIVAETIRRTWNIMSSMHGLYGIMQTGRPTPCPGGMMFTTRVGIWEARTAAEWQEICSTKSSGLMQVADVLRLIFETESGEINEFAITILEVSYGTDIVQQWKAPN